MHYALFIALCMHNNTTINLHSNLETYHYCAIKKQYVTVLQYVAIQIRNHFIVPHQTALQASCKALIIMSNLLDSLRLDTTKKSFNVLSYATRN